jgi:small subunit ribosomal protein S2
MNIPTLEELLKAGVHFGHKQAKWHPAMEPYIFTSRNGVHIINLEKTQEFLSRALEFVKQSVAAGQEILLVGTRKGIKEKLRQAAVNVGVPFVSERWLGGTITNFGSIHGLVKRLKELEQNQQAADYETKYTKWERLQFTEEMERLEKMVGGIREMNKLPDLIFVLDPRFSHTAVEEARKRGIKLVALVDTNVDPRQIDYPIPANDDSIKSVELTLGLVVQAITAGQKAAATAAKTEETAAADKVVGETTE